MLLAEAIGAEAFRERVKIYATDVDEDALNKARQASYSAREVGGIEPALLERYFEQAGGRYVFRKDLRRAIIFGRHDLIQDAPISRIDLITCRNTLMYFNAETQARILARFHFALAETGFLFLGKAEMLLTQTGLFAPLDLRRRIFVKATRGTLRDNLLIMAQAGNAEMMTTIAGQVRLREAAFDTGPLAQIVIDLNGALALANERARALFGLTPRDLGRPLQDIELSYRPVELRSRIDQVYAERRPITLREIEWVRNGESPAYYDIDLAPFANNGSGVIGIGITFTEVTRFKRLQEELQQSSQELETAYEELQSTNEELETTNEELQSTVEELETTNEELQSTNEELETMNEELQSTNEELQTINEELRLRSDELNQVNAFLQSILGSLRSGVVVLDRGLHIQIWSYRAEDLWGLRADEVEQQNFLTLDIGLPVEQLRPAMRACLSGDAPHSDVTVPATNRRGRHITCNVHCTPLVGSDATVRGLILLMDEADGALDEGP
jgi:two-component system CheB/CheR fusion protein